MNKENITIVGAGLVGSLLSILLAKRGFNVQVYEHRVDLRKQSISAGKSINLALSDRGLKPLERAGVIDEITNMVIPMKGRMIHDPDGQLTFQPYGKSGQAINSISRGGLNALLMDTAENLGVKFHFAKPVSQIDFTNSKLIFNDGESAESDIIIGADGAFSATRGSFQLTDRFNYSQYYISHGYKEFHIPAAKNGDFLLEKNALHIWPRQKFMLIALPNIDGSFTVTLFLPFEGDVSFDMLTDNEKVDHFFQEYFPDAKIHIKELDILWNENPTSSLVTVKCFPWVRNTTMLIGDAAHAIVPFYGQGMNCGFEDCGVLMDLLDQHNDWETVMMKFETERKENTDAIADLAIQNYIEMRDLVSDKNFLLRKSIEAYLYDKFPDKWIPQYSMVTFNHTIGYADAQKRGQEQKRIMDEIMKTPEIEEKWKSLNFEEIVSQLSVS